MRTGARTVVVVGAIVWRPGVLIIIDLLATGGSQFIVTAPLLKLLAALSVATSLLMLYQRRRATTSTQQALLVAVGEGSNDAIIDQTLDGVVTETRSRLIFATQAAGVGLWEWNITSGAMHWDDTMFVLFGVSSRDFPSTSGAWRGLV